MPMRMDQRYGRGERKSKSVRFNPEPHVLYVDDDHPEYDPEDSASIEQTAAAAAPPAPGSVLDRVQQYQRRVSQRAAPKQHRPPALPPRNQVPVAVFSTSKIEPPLTPPTRGRTYTLSICRERLSRFKHGNQSGSAELARLGDAAIVPIGQAALPGTHQSLRNQIALSAPEPPANAKDARKRKGRRRCRRRRNRSEEQQADDGSDSDSDQDKPGCIMSCMYFTFECMGCTIS